MNKYLDRLIAKRKIRLVYEIIDDEVVKDMATKKAAEAAATAAAVVEKKLPSLEQELEAVKQRLTDLEIQTKTPKTSKTKKTHRVKLVRQPPTAPVFIRHAGKFPVFFFHNKSFLSAGSKSLDKPLFI